MNKKINKSKSIRFNTLLNNYNNNRPLLTDNYKEMKKKINCIDIIQRNNVKQLKISKKSFSSEKSLFYTKDNNDTNKRKIFYMKNQELKKKEILKPIQTNSQNYLD